MKSILFYSNIFLVAALLGTSCVSPQRLSNTSIPAITPTPTPINLALLNLEPLLFQEGDLPAEYVGGQISNGSLPAFLGEAVPIPQYQIRQELESPVFKQGGNVFTSYVWVGLYDDVSNAKAIYDAFKDGLVQESIVYNQTQNGVDITSSFGVVDFSFEVAEIFGMTFHKCNYVGYIDLGRTEEVANDVTAEMVKFVENLTSRLDEVLNCK